MSEVYKVRDQDRLHFITFATSYWLDIFTKQEYKDVLIDSLKYCQQSKGLELFSWVIMTNHIHMIARAATGYRLQNIIRDFKKYTSVMVCRAIESNNRESRKEWLLYLLSKAANESTKHRKYRLWQNEYHPIELSTNEMMDQKLKYIHENPVEAGWVTEPEGYLYSSARNYAGIQGLLDVHFIE